jgi:hypothetical protein
MQQLCENRPTARRASDDGPFRVDGASWISKNCTTDQDANLRAQDPFLNGGNGSKPLRLTREKGRFLNALVGHLWGRERLRSIKNNRRMEPLGSPGWIRTSDHSINSRMLYR